MVAPKHNSVIPIDDDSLFTKRNGPGRKSRKNSDRSVYSQASYEDDMEVLRLTNILFVKQLYQDVEKLTNVPNEYQVVNSCGEQIFLAVETTGAVTRKSFIESHPFTFSIVDNEGFEVLEVDGHPGIRGIGASVCVKRENQVVGNIIQTNKLTSCCKMPPSYKIEGPRGNALQKIRRHRKKNCWNLFMTDDFDIFSADGAVKTGNICRQKQAISLEEYTIADTYALSFQEDMDGKSKALLVAAVILLDFQFFENSRKGDGTLCLRALTATFAILVLIGAICLFVLSTINFEQERKSRFPGNIAN